MAILSFLQLIALKCITTHIRCPFSPYLEKCKEGGFVGFSVFLSSCSCTDRFVGEHSRFNLVQIISLCLVMGSLKTKPARVFTGLEKNQEPFNQNSILLRSRRRHEAILASCLLPLGPGIRQSPSPLHPHTQTTSLHPHTHSRPHALPLNVWQFARLSLKR